ncbi:MAG TPA: hypothetical protein VFA18_24675 [Gemmataceae bacterium]|nr:hypothetical protein [Gemmataceae bacterium]
MTATRFTVAVAAVLALVLTTCGPASAGRVRYHYVPVNNCGTLTLKPCGPNNATGEYLAWFGASRTAATWQPHVNTQLTFRHPYTGQQVTVPVYLPAWVPKIEYRNHWVIYNYGSFATEIHFLPDGSVDVEYTNGFLRGL